MWTPFLIGAWRLGHNKCGLVWDWEEVFSVVLLGLLEVLQDSTGFSPNELVFKYSLASTTEGVNG